jgi:hypothetical protein
MGKIKQWEVTALKHKTPIFPIMVTLTLKVTNNVSKVTRKIEYLIEIEKFNKIKQKKKEELDQ